MVISLSAASSTIAAALEPATPLANYARQAWTIDNGLPQNTIQALTQTEDGFLWVGTEAGLVRFDGVEFQTYERTSKPSLPSNDIRCLLATKDGALWIGTSSGLARWSAGSITPFSETDGLPSGPVRALTQTTDGVVYVWVGSAKVQFSGNRFIPVVNANRVPATSVVGPERPSISPENGATLPGGNIVIATNREVDIMEPGAAPHKALARLIVGQALPGARVQVVFGDREGSLWIGTTAGLVRWIQGKLERLSVTDPMATASVLALAEDREGNLWVGTETNGLHVIRDQRFTTIDTRSGLSSDHISTVVEDNAGTIWVGTQEDGINALHRDTRALRWTVGRTIKVDNGMSSSVILSMAVAPNGDLWVGTPDGLNRVRGNHIDVFTSADGLADDFIRSLLIDKDGSLWVGTRRGLTHCVARNGTTKAGFAVQQTYTHANGLGSDLVGALARGSNGDLWIATLAGLSRLHGTTISNFTTADGLPSNVVTALLPRPDGTLLIGTQDHGWSAWDGHRFYAATNNSLEEKAIHAILADGRSNVWFAAGDGIARCDADGARNPAPLVTCSRLLEFGTADGLPSRETSTNSHPSAMRSRDGHLWFATPRGLVEVDPDHFVENKVAPPLALKRFLVDDVPQSVGADTAPTIQAGHVHFQFDYAALSLVAPQKVRYRYILEGVDRTWMDAGGRRTAFYTNIHPGHYTFRVQAQNNDGLWNTTGLAFSFELRPHFYQTIWFYTLLLICAAGLVVLVWKQRVRRAEQRFEVVMAERSRIAREIHDTLAQGYTAVSVQLEVLAQLLRQHKDTDAAKLLDKTREYVREGLADARQSIWALRTQDANENTLPVKLRRIAEAAGENGLKSEFSLFGAYRALSPDTEREVVRVAQEAVHNVTKHSGASLVSLELEYKEHNIALEVRDDGRGGVPERVPGDSEGHFGLTGMRERAAAVGGTLVVNSVPGAGTTVRLSVPARYDGQEQSRVRQ